MNKTAVVQGLVPLQPRAELRQDVPAEVDSGLRTDVPGSGTGRRGTDRPDRCDRNRLDRGVRVSHGEAPAFLGLGFEIEEDNLAPGSVQLVELIAADDGPAMPPPPRFGPCAQAELTGQGDADLDRVMHVWARVGGAPHVEHAPDTDEHATRPGAPAPFAQAGPPLIPRPE